MPKVPKKTAHDKFDWGLYPDLEKFVLGTIDRFLGKHRFAKALSGRMMAESSTRFVDWIDHIVMPESDVSFKDLERLGLVEVHTRGDPDDTVVMKHLSSYLFPILVTSNKTTEVALKPESIDDFLQALGNGIKTDGEPYAPFRKAMVKKEGAHALSAIERRGYDGFVQSYMKDTDRYLGVLSAFFQRRRYFDDDDEGMRATMHDVYRSASIIDGARASDAFFRAERAYWQRRNRAGQVQKSRQDRLGLGWGNHDHHTYRSSRAHFTQMIDIFERLGYTCREKYYAGEAAGWGAQILEHPVCNIVVFTDVDLNKDETKIDFAHDGFKEKERTLGTVGLWIGLHGESILQAGMHHLEARFDHERLTKDLASSGVGMMPPFSHFEFLKQAFTVGERWPVDKKRLDALLKLKLVTREQYDEFLKNGAIGSHMENLERDQGFKGFNRASVTKIIMETDPRKQHYSGA